MTDREPDDFYDALRNRLADYGQEPPAPLWANIRAQLPPPVGAPQLRRRARRRWLAALVLLLTAGLAAWHWLPLGQKRTGEHEMLAREAASQHRAPTSLRPGTRMAAPPDSISAIAGQARGGPKPDALVAARPALAEAPAGPESRAAVGSGSELLPPMAALGRLAEGRRGVASVATQPRARVARRRVVLAATQAEVAATASGFGKREGRATRAATRSSLQPADGVLSAGLSSQAEGQEAFAAGSPAREPSTSGSTRYARTGLVATATRQPAKSAAEPAIRLRATALGQPPMPDVRALATSETAPLTLLRVVPSMRPAAARPAQLARADSLPALPVAVVRRWAVQALAGPALTSRLLGPQPLAYAPAPINASPSNSSPRNVIVNSSAAQEQAAAGFGAEVQLQRQLTGRWSLSTGLGYQSFATSQPVAIRVTYGPLATSYTPADSTGTLAVRNTYHFLTLPLRVGYQLGPGHARLRYGLRAGADVALYLGGHSTESSASGTLGRSWGLSGSPYRSFALALSLGADVRYRLAPGWELLAQPTLTQFATSVARPSAGYAPRYPLAATALVGVAWWLR